MDGLYDRAAVLWEHFWDARPANVSTAKISKVLYLMRPGLFPILDSYLIKFYRTAARAAAIDVESKRASLGTRYDGTSSATKQACRCFARCSPRPARHWRSKPLED